MLVMPGGSGSSNQTSKTETIVFALFDDLNQEACASRKYTPIYV
jgi:hypothetical protein